MTHLLDAAAKVTGSDYKTAKLLGRTSQELSDWRHGRRNPQPEDHALVAAIADLDAEEALVRAVLAKHADTPKGERLLSVLGNVLRRWGCRRCSGHNDDLMRIAALLLMCDLQAVLACGYANTTQLHDGRFKGFWRVWPAAGL